MYVNCRLCGSNIELCSIKDSNKLDNNELALFIYKYLEIKFANNDEVLNVACDLCCQVLTNFNNFLKKLKDILQKKWARCICCKKLWETGISTFDKNSFQCSECNVQNSSDNSIETKYKCNVCNKTCTNLRHLKIDKKVHLRLNKCEICDKKFKNQSRLNRHRKTHTGKTVCQCNICGKTYAQLHNLNKHYRIHSGENSYTCEFCGKSFKDSDGVSRHIRTHTGERPYTCKICKKTFTVQSHLKRHEKIHTGDKPYKCYICEKTFATKSNLKAHSRKTHESTWEMFHKKSKSNTTAAKTNISDKILGNGKIIHIEIKEERSIEDTLDKNIEVTPPLCGVCNKETGVETLNKDPNGVLCSTCSVVTIHSPKIIDKIFTNEEISHTEIKEESSLNEDFEREITSLRCVVCNTVCETLDKGENGPVCSICIGQTDNFIEKVVVNTSSSNETTCNICGKTFSKSYIKRHKKYHISNKPYECETCGKTFTEQGRLKRHLKTHSGDKCCQCSVCGKTFSQQNNLIRHYRMHTGEKPYACKICDKKHYDSETLKRHIRIHTGERPYKCKTCGKSFRVHSGLKSHEKVHTDEKPYHCDIYLCLKRFKSKLQLAAHRRTHTGKQKNDGSCESYVCSVCNREFTFKKYLKNHENIHTGEKPYECSICGQRFTQSGSLYNHTKKLHPK